MAQRVKEARGKIIDEEIQKFSEDGKRKQRKYGRGETLFMLN